MMVVGMSLLKDLLIEVMSAERLSTYVPTLLGRKNLRCLATALCRASYSVQGEIFLLKII